MRIKIIIGTLLLSLFHTTLANDDINQYDDQEHRCLAVAIYKEAGSESEHGKIAVGNVIINRLLASGFPDTICGIVKQRSKYVCQFSWACKIDVNRVYVKDESIIKLSKELMDSRHPDNTQGSLFFHAKGHPGWSNLMKTKEIGNHIFYRKRNTNGRNNRSI